MAENMSPDYGAMALDEIAALEPKRGLVAAELEAIGAEIAALRDGRRGALALSAVLGEGTADELERMEAREGYLERRASLCVEALAHVDRRVDGLRRTWLQARYAAALPSEEVPEVLRERTRGAE